MEQVIRRILGVDAKGGESQKFAALETRSIRQSERAPEGSTIHGARPAPILTALAGALTPWSEIRRAGAPACRRLQHRETPCLAAAEHFIATSCPFTVNTRYASPFEQTARMPPLSVRVARTTVPHGWPASVRAAIATCSAGPFGAGPMVCA
jgi:hypothetical protein